MSIVAFWDATGFQRSCHAVVDNQRGDGEAVVFVDRDIFSVLLLCLKAH